jgi:murein DD-endopeptidase MepM/ murein hydrolase activator NlpD
MRWIFTFLAGLLCGAAAMFYLHGRLIPPSAQPAPAVAPAMVIPAPASPAAVPATSTAVSTTSTTTTTTNVATADAAVGPTVPPSAMPVQPAPQITPAVPTQAETPLMIPVAGVKAEALADTFDQQRGERPHEAMDIMAPKGTAVLAAADGKIVKLFNSKPGGLTIYEFDPGETRAYYYAHLDRYAPGLKEGQQVKRGDTIGFVGSSGNADVKAPHLHFTIFELTPEKQWWKGKPVNPYPLLRP